MKKILMMSCLSGFCLAGAFAESPDNYLAELEKNAPTKAELEEPGEVDYSAEDIRPLTDAERSAQAQASGFDAKGFDALAAESLRMNEEQKKEDSLSDKAVQDFCATQGIDLSLAVHARPSLELTDEAFDAAKDMLIECDKGVYFDSAKGLLVYLGNVRLRDPRLNLDCDNQLKVYLQEGPPKAAKEPKDKAQEKTDGKEKKFQSPKTPADTMNTNFDGIKKITAEGNVILNSKDDKGDVYWARAQRATYDGRTAEILLTGLPMLVQYKTHNSVTQDPKAYVRVTEKGQLVFVGKWFTKLRNIQDEKTGFGKSDKKQNKK